MASLLITILFILFSVLLINDPRKWFVIVLPVIYYILPKEACMIGDAKPNILILIVMLTIIMYKWEWKKLIDNKFWYVMLFYFVSSAILSLFTLDEIPYINQFSFLIKKTMEMFLLGVLSIAFFKHCNDFTRFTKYFYTIVLIGSIYGVVSYLISANPYMSFVSTSFRDGITNGAEAFQNEVRGVLHGRISGFANHPLTWGQLHLLFVIVLPFFKRYLSHKLFFWTIIFSSTNIVLTGSRSSMVPLLLFLVGYFLIENRKHFMRILFFCGIFFAVFILLGSFVHNEYIDTLRAYVCFWDESASEKISVSGSSVSMRENQFSDALFFIKKINLLSGFGYGFVSNMSEDHFLREYLLGFESVVLKVVIEQGILGLIFYLFMFLFLCIGVMQYRDNFKDKLFVVLMFVCYLSSLVFTGERCTFQLFFFFLALIVIEKKIRRTDLLMFLKLKKLLLNKEVAAEK